MNVLCSAIIGRDEELADSEVFLVPDTLSVAGGGGGVQDVDRGQAASEPSTRVHLALGWLELFQNLKQQIIRAAGFFTDSERSRTCCGQYSLYCGLLLEILDQK